jgi:SAM-dependent methyltransferase
MTYPPGSPIAPAPRTKSQYAYTRGLDYLRRRSLEHLTVANALTHAWPREVGARGSLDVCDYGAGFGDLCVATLHALRRTYHDQASFRVDVVDSDPSLLGYASNALQARGYRARKLTPQAFAKERRSYDLILASHVLYYISDRPAAIANFASRLTPGGRLGVVLRSDACDTYRIRSAVRQAPGVVPPEPGRPRLRVSDVETMIRDVGLHQGTQEVVATFEVPARDVRHRDLYSNTPTTDATEFIRFVGHIPTTSNARHSAASVVEQELDKRLCRDAYVFRIATSIVTGSAETT